MAMAISLVAFLHFKDACPIDASLNKLMLWFGLICVYVYTCIDTHVCIHIRIHIDGMLLCKFRLGPVGMFMLMCLELGVCCSLC